jgi:hypothetical protein
MVKANQVSSHRPIINIAGPIERVVADATGHHAVGLCLNLGFAGGLGGFASGCVGVAGNGRPMASFTAGAGGGSPSASVGLSVQVSNAKTPEDLRGPFAYAGGSGDEAITGGGGGFVGTGSNNQTIVGGEGGLNIGANIPIPFETHAGSSYTWTTP